MNNLNNLSVSDLINIINALKGEPQQQQQSEYIGMVCIIRTYSAGVWYGQIVSKNGEIVVLNNARRLWRWKAKKSISLSAVAKYGIDQNESKIAPAVNGVELTRIEILPVSVEAKRTLDGAPEAEQS